jgi:class 3 adenylate cyclase
VTGGQAAAPVERALATLLFTDIVDSTRRAADLGDSEWRPLLERHNAIVEDSVTRFGGRACRYPCRRAARVAATLRSPSTLQRPAIIAVRGSCTPASKSLSIGGACST